MLEARVDRLEAALASLAEAVALLTRRLDRVEVRLDALYGRDLERTYRERAAAFFMDILGGIRPLPVEQVARIAEEAERAGRLTAEERRDLLRTDLVVEGRREGAAAFLVVEVSAVVDKGDVERAVRRAALLARATGAPVVPVAAGEQILGEAEREAQAQGVWRVLDGRTYPPGQP